MFVLYTPNSESINRIVYDPETLELYVTFARKTTTYVYYNVRAKVVKHFANAKSKGKFFNEFIRPHYKFKEIINRAQPENDKPSPK